MSTRIASSGMTSNRQKPSVIHFRRASAAFFFNSNSPAAKGFSTGLVAMAGAVSMSGFVRFLHALHDEIAGDVDGTGYDEEDDAEDEQHLVMLAAVHGLAHFR